MDYRSHFGLFPDDYDDTEVERGTEADEEVDADNSFDCVGVLIAMLIGLALAYGVFVEMY